MTAVGIGLQDAAVVPQMGLRMLALAVGRVAVPGRGWLGASGGPVVANVDPQAACLRPAATGVSVPRMRN